eukprot:879884-Pyramimonas_sp.AAC.1
MAVLCILVQPIRIDFGFVRMRLLLTHDPIRLPDSLLTDPARAWATVGRFQRPPQVSTAALGT